MKYVATLVQNYEQALAAAATAAKPEERSLYSLLMQEFRKLQLGLRASDSAAIQESLVSQEQLFGRSFLTGKTGETAELAFNQVSRALQSPGA
jgi:hypothetical protein